MLKDKKRRLFCVILFLIPLIKIFAHNIEEAVVTTASSYVYIKSDSILESRYKSLNKRFENNEDSNLLMKEVLDLNDIAKENNQYDILILTNYLIGKIFSKVDNFNRAKEFFNKSLYYSEQNSPENKSNNKNFNLYNEILLKLGNSHYYRASQIDSDSEISKGDIIFRASQIDSALYYYNRITLTPSFDNKNLTIKAKSFANISGIFYEKSDYNEAKKFISEAIKIHKRLNAKLAVSASLNTLASIYMKENKFDEAKNTYEEAINLIKFETSERAIKHLEDLYFNYAWTLYNLKDYKAYDYLESSYIIKDSIRDLNIRKAIEEIYAINNVEKVKKEEALKRLEANKKTWLIGLSSTILIIALAFIAGYYRLRQKNLGLKLSQNKLLQEQKIERLKSLSQKRILNATIDGKETERKEIAETLHDSVSALLSSANLHLQATKNKFNGKTPLEVEKSQQIIIEASQKIRNLSHNLVSSVLLKFGIKYAINDLVNKYSNSQIEFTSNVENLPRFNQNFEIKVHNIIQELVNNILKHSEAKKASISVDIKNEVLQIVISDDGIGFNMKDLDTKDGLGINQIDARIQMMNGKLSIKSVPKKGTTIIIEIPTSESEIANHV